MKTLRERASELDELKKIQEGARTGPDQQEAKMANALATDAENYAAENSIPIQTSTSGGELKIERTGRLASWIKVRVTLSGAGPISYSVSSTDVAPEVLDEDKALEAILTWLRKAKS